MEQNLKKEIYHKANIQDYNTNQAYLKTTTEAGLKGLKVKDCIKEVEM